MRNPLNNPMDSKIRLYRGARMKNNKKLYNFLIVPAVILAASVIRAIGIYSFVVPNDFAPGGVTGLASILQYLTGWNAGIYLFLLNIPLLFVAFFCVSKPFAIKTTAATVLTSAIMLLLEKVNFFTFTSSEKVLAGVAGGILGGLSLAMLFKIGGTTGGTDIVATLIQRKFSATNVSWFIFMLDSTVVVASFFVYGMVLEPVLYAFVEMFCSSKICEAILHGLKSAIKYEIVTDHPDEIADEILHRLRRGVTKIPAVGMYSRDEKALLVCVVRRRQVSEFNHIIKKYPGTFAYMTGTSEVMGIGFSS